MNVVTLFRSGRIVALIAMLAVILPFFASNAWATATGNKWVSAEVSDDGFGHITFYGYPGDPGNPNYSLSFREKSFLSLMLNGDTYTNNDLGTAKPTPKGILSNGITTHFGSGSGPDTVRTIWSINGIDIIQDVYPVEFEISGQIVLRIAINNKTGSFASVQAQYLLDLDVNGNDGDTVLTRWGYNPNWAQFPASGGGRPIPPFYMAFQNGLPPKSFVPNPKNGVGWLDRPELGLIQPVTMTVGDWTTLINYAFGPPPTIPNQPYKDNAILMVFPGTGAAGNSKVEVARTSYGTGEFDQCVGSLYSLTFYPHRVKYDPALKRLNPNPFTVETLIFNTSSSSQASNMNATLSVGPSLTILSPTPVTGSSQTHAPFPNSIAPLGVGDITWTVRADRPAICTGDIQSGITVAVSAQGGFVQSPCDFPLIIECAPTDVNAPVFDRATGAGFRDSSFNVHDSLPTDLGLKNISWNVSSGQASNFTISTNPGLPLSNCPKTPVTVSVHQIDSTQGGCIDFVATDCQNLTSTFTMCFRAHPVKINSDTTRPRIRAFGHYHWPTINGQLDSSIACHAQCDSMIASDADLYDRGLRSINVVPGSANNMRLVVQPFPVGSQIARFSVCVIDSLNDGSIKIFALDSAGNRSADTLFTYCTVPDTLSPLLVKSNYANGRWHLHITDDRPWDRGFGDIQLTSMVNVNAVPNPTPATIKGLHVYDLDLVVQDTFSTAGFCVLAIDSAGNRHKQFGDCLNNTPPEDIWLPNIIPTIPLATSPISDDFDVNDYHLSAVNDTINYDAGIDSVYFTGVQNMTLIDGSGNTYVNNAANPTVKFPAIHNPYLGPGHQPFARSIPRFTLKVSDTAAVDPTACVTIHAVDGRERIKPGPSNITALQWCYPVTLDTFAPVITGTSSSHTAVNVMVSDNRTLDRGLRIIQLDRSENFDPINDTLNGSPTSAVTLKVTTPGKSAFGRLTAVDVYGSKLGTPAGRLAHTASDSVAIYVENLKMKIQHVVLQSGNFTVPIYLDSTDDVPLIKKQLSAYAFSFHLQGSPLVQFIGPVTVGTESATWNVGQTSNAGTYTITGSSVPAGTVLSDQSLPLLYLEFHGDSSASAALTTVVLDGPAGSEVAYNGGLDRTIIGNSATIIQPAPYGSLTGGNITLKGYCSPLVSTGGKPTAISIAPTSPNPTSSTTQVEYTVPVEGMVRLELYNALGVKVQTVLNEVQQQGEYRLTLSAQNLAEGNYFLRLETNGSIVSRRVTISR